MVIKTNGSKKKTNFTVGVGHYLTQKVVQSRKIETFLRKEKYGATFATLEDNLVTNKMLTGAKIMKSDAFFRLTVAAMADILAAPANIP
jgi:hypothetical protein